MTATGVRLALEGVALEADDLDRDRHGLQATVTVRVRDRIYARERLNLDRPRQRAQFVARLHQACAAVDAEGGADLVTAVARRVTDAILIALGEACRHATAAPSAADLDGAPVEGPATVVADDAPARLAGQDVLLRVAEAMRAAGYAGNPGPALLIYVALTSRLLDRPMNVALIGEPAAGKNATLEAALALVPEEAVFTVTASSPLALVYAHEDFRHRVVIFQDADALPARGPAAAAIRALADGQSLRYGVPTRAPKTRTFRTEMIRKDGPTGLITTSTRPVPIPLYTRLLPVRLAHDPVQTYAIIRAKAERAAGRRCPPDRVPFLALQRWLAGPGNRRVSTAQQKWASGAE